MKKVLLAAALLTAAQQASAQFNLGAGLTIPKYGSIGWQPGIQARAAYDFFEGKYSVAAGFNFSPLGITEKEDMSYDDGTGAMKSYGFSTKYNFNNAFLQVYRIFGSEENTFRFFIYGGASIDFVSIKSSVDGVAPNGVTLQGGNESLKTSKVNFGIGGNYALGESGKLYAELGTGLRANQANGQYIENPGVSHYGVTVGYKYYFGGNSYY